VTCVFAGEISYFGKLSTALVIIQKGKEKSFAFLEDFFQQKVDFYFILKTQLFNISHYATPNYQN